MVNKRRRTRINFAAKADVNVTGAQLVDLTTRDLSHKGVFVLGSHPLTVGQHCTVTIRLQDDPESDVELFMEGKVARSTIEGTAIDFISMDPDTYMHLRKLVLLNSPNPDEAASEFAKPAFDPSTEKD